VLSFSTPPAALSPSRYPGVGAASSDALRYLSFSTPFSVEPDSQWLSFPSTEQQCWTRDTTPYFT
jgi:hypothetical protein